MKKLFSILAVVLLMSITLNQTQASLLLDRGDCVEKFGVVINPTTADNIVLSFEAKQRTGGTVSIIDYATGQTVYVKYIALSQGTNTILLNDSDMPPLNGEYILDFKDDCGGTSRKVHLSIRPKKN